MWFDNELKSMGEREANNLLYDKKKKKKVITMFIYNKPYVYKFSNLPLLYRWALHDLLYALFHSICCTPT